MHQYLSNFVTFFSFAENFYLTSFLGGPVMNFLVNLENYMLYEFLRRGKKSENNWIKAKKVYQYLSIFVIFSYFAEIFHLTSFLGGQIIFFLVNI